MEWLSHPEHQGIATLIAILQIACIIVVAPGYDGSRSLGVLERIVRGLAFLVTGWGIYSILWGLLAFTMSFPPLMALSPGFFVLGSFTVIGALATKSPVIGGFLGGSVPLAAVSLFSLSLNPQMQEIAPPFAWFGAFMMFGGLLGALIGPATIRIIQAIMLQTHAWRRRGKKKKLDNMRNLIPFDVFLSRNSKDKAAVRQLTQALETRGLCVWLDVEQLVPGHLWQEELEKIIQTTRTAAVLIGQDGLGPWEIPEMRVCLSQFVKRHMPVIFVLLPGAPEQPELPFFLQELTWVDLRNGLTEDNMNRLEWGITGTKP